MTYRTIRQRLLLSAGSTVIMGLFLAAAANSQASATDTNRTYTTANDASMDDGNQKNANRFQPTALHHHFWEALVLEPQDAWSSLRSSFQWQEKKLPADAQARVDEWIEYYRSSPHNIAAITERATPWLAWIAQQVSDRGLPGEIALIPFVESSFDPSARSHLGAAGLWQFMPGTGDALGLVRNGNYDGRLDVVTSTEAALDYLEMQADQWYEGDLMLSLAAYNAGAGTVNRAQRQAQSQGLDGKYWDLSLPHETMQYVPKLKAIATIINDPEKYGVSLPDIHPDPAFAKVQLEQPVSLAQASQLLDVSQSALAELNPGLLNGSLDPRSAQTLLVPEEVDTQVLAQLSQSDDTALASASTPSVHRVERGDNLSAIAAQYNLDQQDLIRWNAIDRPEALQPGQLLSLSGR
ncbi:transglycosylase SLT domain-containing protein [Vreelandella aquamarina]|uniref:Membrane-bound lytic murein transglycosylase D n=1 Tax=Vreelandella aquamarina TaxID=77097 RepID=A0A1H8DEF3_9GAMM|nr:MULTISPECIES: transglycosylase SLT domain-containing protein [Halomonas]MCD1649828.1 transglycosylase SLT domain-containing protein [Halomonas axialensis]MCD2086166.1 transglycosylase SLT domain-containing protein [Halomonas meridiana]SEN05536.1 membrane-bound lytic murein transglycosylase D [Halomonas aquamarina]